MNKPGAAEGVGELEGKRDRSVELPSDENVASVMAENAALRRQLADAVAECEEHRKVQQEIMMLLHAKSPARLVHDLRNMLNELVLLQTLAARNPRP